MSSNHHMSSTHHMPPSQHMMVCHPVITRHACQATQSSSFGAWVRLRVWSSP